MAYISLKSTTTILLLFAALYIARAAFVLDTDGEQLFNGRKYYIRPQTIGFGGGLTITPKNESQICPFYITRDNDETSNGIALSINSPLRILNIPLSSPVSIAFEEIITICIQTLGWGVTSDDSTGGQLYVTTGASQFNYRFSIEQAEGESRSNVYKIRYVSESGEVVGYVGFFIKDGLLGITDEIPLTVTFKKAFDVIEEITSSS